MTGFTSRHQLLEALSAQFLRAGVDHAFQGSKEACETWLSANDERDLDIWVSTRDAARVARLMRRLGMWQVAGKRDTGWLNHDVYAGVVGHRPAIVDCTVGDLRVGPVGFCPEDWIVVRQCCGRPRLTGWGAVGDLVIRPLLRGRRPSHQRLSEGRDLWRELSDESQEKAVKYVQSEFGNRQTKRLVGYLRGDQRAPRLRRRMIMTTFVKGGRLKAAWRNRRSLLSGSHFSRFRRERTVIALLGTDGTGKSTTSDRLVEVLKDLGVEARTVYFGRGRGNIPGIDWIRTLVRGRHQRADDHGSQAGWPNMVKLASWYYAFEYALRYWVIVYPRAAWAGEAVVLDRFVYDVRTMEGASPAASTLVERLVLKPEVIALLDPSPAEIVRRKSERSLSTIKEHQKMYRNLVSQRPGTCQTVSITDCPSLEEVVDRVASLVVPCLFRSQIDEPLLRGPEGSPRTFKF